MPRFAANLTMLFTEAPFLARFDAAARAGFRAVEFVSPYEHPAEEVARAARDAGVETVLFNLPPGDWAKGDRGMACDPSRTAELREGVERALAYAGALGCARLHLMAGIRPAGVPETALRESYLAALRLAGRALDARGIALLVEGINGRDMPGYYLQTSRQAFELMDAAGVPNLHYQYDVYHMQIMEGDLAATIERRIERIGHVQIADPPARNEPGTGEVSFPFLFRLLDRIGYRGWVGCEYRPRAGTLAGLSWMDPWR
ncbi:MAG TPA: 2-oxo-tetronate isomerase [Anaeromyxobacter sp.]|nr:2-oxo-tetronate isomerase [Anaeromyxobacter sp.]